MSKKPHYLDWCYIPILKGVFIVVCTDDYKWVAKKFNAPDLVDCSMYGTSLHAEHKGYEAYVLILNLWRGEPVYKSIVSHEAVHIAKFLMKSRDWTKLNNPEPLCYISEWFVNKTYQFLKKNKLHKLVVNDNSNQ